MQFDYPREGRSWLSRSKGLRARRALYSFTPESHPAHPSYVKREVVEKDGSIYMETSARCGAEKAACDPLIRDFIGLNNKVKTSVNAQ